MLTKVLRRIIPSATRRLQATIPIAESDVAPANPNSVRISTIAKSVAGTAIAAGVKSPETENPSGTEALLIPAKPKWEILPPDLQPFKHILLRCHQDTPNYLIGRVGVSPEVLYDVEYKSAPHIYKGFTKYAKRFKRIIERGEASFKENFKDAEILIIGPGKGAGEILEFAKLFPDAASIHIVDIRESNFVQIDRDLEEYKQKGGVIKPVIYGYITDVAKLPKELEESMDLVYHTNVFDLDFFTYEQAKQAASEVTRVIKQGGVHVTTYLTGISSWLCDFERIFNLFVHDNHEEGFTKHFFDKNKLVLQKGGAFQIRLKK